MLKLSRQLKSYFESALKQAFPNEFSYAKAKNINIDIQVDFCYNGKEAVEMV